MYEYRAVVRGVHDGDTVTLDVDLGYDVWAHNMHIRMIGINAPEIRQSDPKGYESRDYLRGVLPIGLTVVLQSEMDRADKYGGRWLGTIWLATFDAKGQPILATNTNELMVSSGHAVVYLP